MTSCGTTSVSSSSLGRVLYWLLDNRPLLCPQASLRFSIHFWQVLEASHPASLKNLSQVHTL